MHTRCAECAAPPVPAERWLATFDPRGVRGVGRPHKNSRATRARNYAPPGYALRRRRLFSAMRIRNSLLAASVLALTLVARNTSAQAVSADSVANPIVPVPHPHYKLRFALGFLSSILAHESGHIIASYAVGGRPSFGFDHWRPTIYSGIDSELDPHKQFIFSSAGLTVQTLLDE